MSPANRIMSPAARIMSPATRIMSPATRIMSPAARIMSPATRIMSPATRIMSPATRIMSPATRVMSPATRIMSPAARIMSTSAAAAARSLCKTQLLSSSSASAAASLLRQFRFSPHRAYVASKKHLEELYRSRKAEAEEQQPTPDQNPEAIFANNELSLQNIEIYGFDYDYTLATYTLDLHKLIFTLGRDALVNKLRYPEGILEFEYDADFAVRGLHYDIKKGLFLKIDQFHNIQLGTVYRGLQPVPDEEVKFLYEGIHVPVDYMNTFYGVGPMHQMVDLFALPEVTLISLVAEYFIKNNINYDSEYVFYDIRSTVQSIHTSGILHQAILKDLDLYLYSEKCHETKLLLENLSSEGKKLFLVSNSGFPFIDQGMKYMVGEDWLDLFDVVIVNARKPKFFKEGSRPFRIYNVDLRAPEWGTVTSLKKGTIYHQGNHQELQKMTGWYGPKVLYFGDHVYSDLADPSLKYGWRTAAIIPELEAEIQKQNSEVYKANVRWLVGLQHLINEMQHQNSQESIDVINSWLEERNELRKLTKSLFNPQFGSLFRTYHNPTYFFRRLARFADIYMSSLTNLSRYSVNYTFYPHRILLPHEPSLYSSRGIYGYNSEDDIQ